MHQASQIQHAQETVLHAAWFLVVSVVAITLSTFGACATAAQLIGVSLLCLRLAWTLWRAWPTYAVRPLTTDSCLLVHLCLQQPGTSAAPAFLAESDADQGL